MSVHKFHSLQLLLTNLPGKRDVIMSLETASTLEYSDILLSIKTNMAVFRTSEV